MTIKEQLYQFTGSSQHVEFERELQAMVFDRERREKFYRNIIDTDWGRQLEHDTFRSYFEEYAAESARATSRITHLGRLLFYWHDSLRTVPNQCVTPITRGGISQPEQGL